jgi:hypothetical protein
LSQCAGIATLVWTRVHASSFLCLGWCRFDEETAHQGAEEIALSGGPLSRQIRPTLLPVHGRTLDERDAPLLVARGFSIRTTGAFAFIADSPLGVGARSEGDMVTSRTSARWPTFALTLRLANRRRLRPSSSSAAESERAQLSARPSATSEARRSIAFERFRLGASLGVAGRSRLNSSSEKAACGKTLLRTGAHLRLL